MRIRCPQCRWEPDGGAHWSCDACRTCFDTFATGARCPGCAKCFLETQCIRCAKWSLHEDWFDGYWDSLLKVASVEELPLELPGRVGR